MVGSQQAEGPCDDVRKVFVTRRDSACTVRLRYEACSAFHPPVPALCRTAGVASGGAQARCSGPLRMFPTSLWDVVPWLCISDPAATRKKSALAFAAYSINSQLFMLKPP